MALGIISRTYRTQTRGTVELDRLAACIGESIRVTTDISFAYMTIASDDNVITFNPDPKISGQLYNDDIVMTADTSFFNNCQVGDTLLTDSLAGSGNIGSFTIAQIISGGMIRASHTMAAEQKNSLIGIQFLANITALKSLFYQAGISSNGYESQTDGELQKFTIQTTTALQAISVTALNAMGLHDWVIDTTSVTGLGYGPGGTNTEQRIRIIHDTVVTPLYLVGQYDDMRNGIAPDYFKADNTIKYNSQIDWNKSSDNLSDAKQLVMDSVGQFGWFGTKPDGSKPDYSITSLTIRRVSDSEFVNQLEYVECEVVIHLASAASAFHATNSKLILGFNYLPEDPSFYQNTDRLLSTNFCFDTKLFNPDGTPVNGSHFGTNDQVIKTVKGDIVSTSVMTITARILFGSNRVPILRQDTTAQYALWVICENISSDIALSDKCNLLAQVNILYEQLTTINLLSDTTKFIIHPYTLVANGVDAVEMFPVDDIVANSLFSIDYTGKENDGILLKSCTPELVLSHTSEADIILDSFKINLDNFPLVGSAPAVQGIDFNQKRPYKIEDGIKKSIAFERNYALDSGETKNFSLNFPFMNRWEYWLQVAGVSYVPTSLFDNTVPFNGMNHLWNRLVNSSGWSLKYRVMFEIIQNGQLFEQQFDHVLTSTYFDSNTDWNNCSIKTYDIATNSEIIVSAKKYAYATVDTKVVASFEKTVGIVPDIANIAIVIWGESFEGGGISEITRISSIFDVTDVSMFKSIDSSNKVVVNKSGDIFTGTAIIRADKVAALSKMSLYARIYEINAEDPLDRITEDFIIRMTTDGQNRLVLG